METRGLPAHSCNLVIDINMYRQMCNMQSHTEIYLTLKFRASTGKLTYVYNMTGFIQEFHFFCLLLVFLKVNKTPLKEAECYTCTYIVLIFKTNVQ